MVCLRNHITGVLNATLQRNRQEDIQKEHISREESRETVKTGIGDSLFDEA